jgi:hypothetical protein
MIHLDTDSDDPAPVDYAARLAAAAPLPINMATATWCAPPRR